MQDVLEVVQAGKPFEDIIRDHYPDLTVEDIRACVQYAMEIVAIEELHVETVPA